MKTVVAETAPATSDDATVYGPVKLTFNKTSDPRFIINAEIIDPYLKLIEQATEGRVAFVDPPVVNTNARGQLDLVTSGQVDTAYVFNGYLEDTHPLLSIPMIPLMGGSAQQTAISLWNLHDRYLSKTDYFDGAHVLGFVAAPTSHIWHRRDAPVEAGETILARNAYPVPYFEGLDTIGPKRVQEKNAGMFGDDSKSPDGSFTFMMAHGAARGAGIWNADRSVTEVENGIYTPTFTVVLSNKAWTRISPADRNTINTLSGLAFSQRSARWDDFDNGHWQIMLDSGLEVAYPDRASLQELEGETQKRLQDWAAIADKMGIPQSRQSLPTALTSPRCGIC